MMKSTIHFILLATLLLLFGQVNAQVTTGPCTNPPGDPAVFGNGFWNVYCYNGNMMANPSTAVYKGYYTENNLSFNSNTRFVASPTAVPSEANGSSGKAYSGCSPITMIHTICCKRKNLPFALYQIDIPLLDDNGFLFINGVEVWRHIGWGSVNTNVWSGFLDSTSTIEFRWVNINTYSSAAINIKVITPTTSTASYVSNKSFTANWSTVSNGSTYYVDVDTDSNFTNPNPTFTNLNVGNISSYKVNNLTSNTNYYYRVRAGFGNKVSGNSNVTKVKTLDDVALPVSFLEFNVSKGVNAEDPILLEWSTAFELNNDFFEVEKSLDGTTFHSITKINGAGNSNKILNYSAVDKEVNPGTSYYRIKQTDFDKKSSYSIIVCMNYKPSSGFTICPNPGTSGDAIYVSLPEINNQQILIVVRDAQGQEYYSKVILDTENHQLVAINPQPELAPGMYVVVASSNNEIFSQKIIVK